MQDEAVLERPIAGLSWLLGGLAAVVAVLGGFVLGGIFGSGSSVRVSAEPAAVSPVAALSDLPAAAQAPVSAALGHADRAYWVHGLVAANPVNRLRARFGVGAVTVTSAGGGSVRFVLAGSGAPRVRVNRAVYANGRVRAVYANGPLGVEQSFVLVRGASVSMIVRGSLRPSLRDGGLLLTGGGGTLRYAGLIATDARGRRLPARIELRGDRLVLSADTSGARYPVRIDPFVQAGNLNEANPPLDAFGYSSAVSGSTIAIGAPAHSVGGKSSQGAVFVFTEPSTGWASSTTSRMLTASDGAANDELGFTVATNGTTIVSGTPNRDSGTGATYVWVQHSGTWPSTQTAELVPPGATTDDAGYLPVAISPDSHTIVVGLRGLTVSGHAQQGEAFAFTEPSGGWGSATPTVADFTASDGAAMDEFGLEVAASDSTIAVTGGVGGEGTATSAVYVFTKSGSAWASGTQTAELSPGSAQDVAVGSGSLALSPDAKTIVAGAPVATVAANQGQGEAFVFAEPGSGWHDAAAPNAILTSSDGALADAFGFATGASDDTIVVAAPQHAVGGTDNIGGIYVYDEPATGWSGDLTQTQELNPQTTTGGGAGYSLGFDGATIVAGTRGHSQGAWVFTNPALRTTTTTGSGATAPPANIGAPSISGTAGAGQTLTCAYGTWTNSPTGYAYQWLYDGTPIQGATRSTYVVVSVDEGLSLTCTVIASNAKGAGAPATSAPVPVPVPKVKNCPAATGNLFGPWLGRVRLGMTRAQARHAYTRSSTRGKRYEDFFCLTPIGVRVGYGSKHVPKAFRKKVIWASTSSAYYALRGIRVGATIAAAGKSLKLAGPYKVGRNSWYLTADGAANGIFKVRAGLIEEIGIAERKLTGSTAARKRFLHSFS